MQPSPFYYQPPPRPGLPAAVSAELERLEAEVGHAADPLARARLAELGEAAASRVLRKIWESRHGVRKLSPYVMRMVDNEVMERNAAGIAAAESAACGLGPSRAASRDHTISDTPVWDHTPTPVRDFTRRVRLMDGPSGRTEIPDAPVWDHTTTPVRDITRRVRLMDGPSGRVGVATPPLRTESTTEEPSLQKIALGELEFDRIFLIYVYLAGKKLEEVIEDVNYIWYLKYLPMDCFESEIWKKFGHVSLPESDRRKNLDWDPSKTRLYYCILEKIRDSIVTIFKGPYIDNTRTHLQKVVGDDNVLIVKFTDIPELMSSDDNFGMYCMHYGQVVEDGIPLGLRRYRFFVYKDGGNEDKQKEEQNKAKNKKYSPSVRCFFVRTESGWDRDMPYILSGCCTVDQARRRFMDIQNAPTLSKYMSRFSLILSKTITLDIDFSEVNVKIIEDKPCKDKHGNIVTINDGEPLIHTDGTGLISFDLATKCPVGVFKGNLAHQLQDTVDSEKHRYLISYPLLIQFRMFYNGNAVKGTVLAYKRLPDKTIYIRPSMIKIKADSKSLVGRPFNSLEVVTTSKRPKKGVTSRFLIALLHYGGVSADFFMELQGKALEDANKAHHKAGESLEVALNHAGMDDLMSAQMILAGIQPEDEAFLQYQLYLMTKEERKGIQEGRIPIDDCCYLMGTTDPTGTLKPDQVCVIHDNRQVSGKVLVYKHPGLHFGDIHKLNATHIDGLEEIVGDSKYAIFFPTSGSRSLADEMANSDFDGDMYWVSWNPQLLNSFEPSKPWEHRTQPEKTKQKKPQDYDGPELESLLFCEFLRARFSPSYVLGTATNCWLALMDQILTPGVSQSEKDSIKINMLELVDICYWAVDAPKNGDKIKIPWHLMVKKYPHYMEREPSYHSTSLLGNIYDRAKLQKSETVPPISEGGPRCNMYIF